MWVCGFTRTVLVAALLSLPTFCVGADEWDQRNDPSTFYGITNLAYYPLQGQEFVPDLARMNIAQLWIDGSYCEDECGSLDLSVRLREESIFGTLLATSEIQSLASGFRGIVTLNFPDTTLSPGNKYVLEIVLGPYDGLGIWGVVYTSPPSFEDYERGNRIYDGVVQRIQDLWFREGFAATVPVANTTWGSIKANYLD